MKKIILLYLIFSILCLTQGIGAQDKIVAVVNREIITQSDVNNFSKFIRMQLATQYHGKDLEEKFFEIMPRILERLIEDKLIIQEAKKEGIKIDEARIKAALEEMKRQYPSENAFREDIVRQGLTQADIEDKIRNQLMMQAIIEIKIRNKIRINPKEVTDFYQQHQDELNKPASRDVLSISIPDAVTARRVWEDLKKKDDFSEVAHSYNLQVNELGQIQPGQLKKELDEIISLLAVGEISDIVKFDNKFYIFKLQRINPPQKRSFEEVKQDIYNYIFEQKMQDAMDKWLNELKAKAYIEIKNS
ncbi:MAG: peptidyl-prolyl cis-trans isomerase [Candidatus Omnitrophica bacterium]|nr:peptidyl-prolyl cis-trans isomerase [Candidatus Omnitrophota bacterium]